MTEPKSPTGLERDTLDIIAFRPLGRGFGPQRERAVAMGAQSLR